MEENELVKKEKNKINENKELVLFENSQIRRQMYNGEWNYVIADIIEILTNSKNPNTYWRVMKKRLADEGNESVTNCNELKIPSKKDGKPEVLQQKIMQF